ncbi:hypothetical protein [Butyrivibrio proteoclasticus]|uniref:hypothetical protein n=1 Tax=Butyrivibrio proteoclasticus TaxID=43305 RepID=UPI0004799A58|nr:hypothetical protein [Butyrivibrio proteoclasticus]
MLKKYSITLLEIMLFMILCGCNIDSIRVQHVPFIGEFGPNVSYSKYFYYRDYIYTESADHFELVRYDVETMEKKIIYVTEDSDDQRIEEFYGDDEGVFFVFLDYTDDYCDSSLIYHDNTSGQNQSVLCSRDDIFIVKTNSGPIIGEGSKYYSEGNKYYSLEKENGKYSIVETATPVEEQASKGERKLGIRNKDGVVVAVISKMAKDPYTYQVGETTEEIDALNGKYAEKTELSDNYVVEDGKVFGVVQSTSIEYKYYSGYDNSIIAGQLKGEALYEFDLVTHEGRILYEVKGNKKQIIGYEEGYVYIYKKSKIIKHSLETGKEEVIYEIINMPEGQISFNWVGSTLVIYDTAEHEVVGTVKVEN